MNHWVNGIWRRYIYQTLAIVALLGYGEGARAQDWPQWRGPEGQGTTSAKDLPPTEGSTSLKVLWKTPIPGEGCSSPVVSQGRVYLTTAYEGTEPHAWDAAVFWVITIIGCSVVGLALTQVPKVFRSLSPRPILMAALSAWTGTALVLTSVVLIKPTWFWQFADPWTGTTVGPAEIPWIESLNLRPALVLLCGSLLPIFAALTGNTRGGAEAAPPSLTRWLGLVTFTVTVITTTGLGLIAWRSDWFFQASQSWLAWLVTGGLCLFALAGSLGWLGFADKVKLLLVVAGLALAGWLFCDTPQEEPSHIAGVRHASWSA